MKALAALTNIPSVPGTLSHKHLLWHDKSLVILCNNCDNVHQYCRLLVLEVTSLAVNHEIQDLTSHILRNCCKRPFKTKNKHPHVKRQLFQPPSLPPVWGGGGRGFGVNSHTWRWWGTSHVLTAFLGIFRFHWVSFLFPKPILSAESFLYHI